MRAGYEKQFSYNQCTYYPSEALKFLGAEIFKNQHEKGFLENPEKAIRRVFQEFDIAYYNYRPCLVQHLDDNSVIGHDSVVGKRRTPFFIDYLDDLNIKYEDAQDIKVRYRLVKYMYEWFEKKEKEGGLVT